MAVSPFQIIKHLSEKTPLEFEIKEYNSWMVNRGLSNIMDTIFFANELNGKYSLDKDQQYQFYMNAIPKGKRYGEWGKAINNNDVNLIQEAFQVNQRVAEKYLSLLTQSQIEELRKDSEKGGKS